MFNSIQFNLLPRIKLQNIIYILLGVLTHMIFDCLFLSHYFQLDTIPIQRLVY